MIRPAMGTSRSFPLTRYILPLSSSSSGTAELMTWLKTRGPEFDHAFARSEVIRAAIDQAHVRHDAAIGTAREIAFFPPVTGG